MRKRTIQFCAAFLFLITNATSFQIASSQAQTASHSTYGMNVEYPGLTDGAFVDILRSASAWTPSSGGSNPPLTENGYPTAGPVGGASYGEMSTWFCLLGYPAGVCNFYGEGIYDVNFGLGFFANQGYPNSGYIPGTLKKTVRDDGVVVTTCQTQINVPPPILGGWGIAQGLQLSVLEIKNINPNQDPKNYPNNFHLTCPGQPAWQPDGQNPRFTPWYLQALRPFACLRFMDWMGTNGNNGPYSWADRPQVAYYGRDRRSGFYEDIIELCNDLNCDMWLNVPCQATQDWKVGMATLIHQGLKPGLHVYIEHCNEMWNWGQAFWQNWNYVDQQAQANFGVQPAWENHGKEMGLLLMSDVTAMAPILNSSDGQVCRPILAGQFGNPIYLQGGLEYITQAYGPPSQYLYGIAGATYWGVSSNEPPGTAPVVGMIDSINGGVGPPLKQCMQMAKQYGLQFCCYETGDAFGSAAQTDYDASLALEVDPSIEQAYYAWANLMQSNGVALSNFFSNSGVWSKFGFWSFLPMGQLIYNPPPKYIAAAAIANAANGRNSGGNGGGSGGGSGNGNGNGGGMGRYKFKPGMPSHKKMMPVKHKGWPMNGHPYRTMPGNGHSWKTSP